MEQENNFILIIGSKPESKLPDLKVEAIYTANGAAQKATEYLKKYTDSKFISVVSGREFEKNLEVQTRVVQSKPDFLFSRSDYIEITKYNFLNSMKFAFYSNFKQFLFQCQFFKLNILDLFISEFNYKDTIKEKLLHVVKTIKNLKFNGVSTGFFTILYALKFHPKSKIIIAGIGMQGGGHFYNQDSTRYTNRSKVDRALMKSMKVKYKERLFTIDLELAKSTDIKFLDVKTF